jgi:hypothetical protein
MFVLVYSYFAAADSSGESDNERAELVVVGKASYVAS